MPKRKGKRAKVEDPVTDAKLNALRTLSNTFQQHVSDQEDYLNAKTEEICEHITKMYQERLQLIPENIRKMTVSEIMLLQEREKRNGTQNHTPEENQDVLRSVFERNKQATEKKKTLKKDKKRSLSASSSTRPMAIGREPAADYSRMSRTLSESSVFTPLGKQAWLPSLVITPKFNPKLPVSRMARRPRAGEILMSLSGSPLQHYENEVSLSLGGGKGITFDDGAVVDKDFIKQLDEPFKKKLEDVKNQLDKILKY